MQTILWSIGSLVILIPVIYFLPLGFTKKGKWLVVFISFIFAILALAVNELFSLWKTAVMILLLLGIIVYFIDKKFAEMILATNQNDDELFEMEIQKNDDSSNWTHSNSSQRVEADKKDYLPEIQIDEVINERDELSKNMETPIDSNSEVIKEDLAFLLNADQNLVKEETELESEKEAEMVNEIEEFNIEDLLETDLKEVNDQKEDLLLVEADNQELDAPKDEDLSLESIMNELIMDQPEDLEHLYQDNANVSQALEELIELEAMNEARNEPILDTSIEELLLEELSPIVNDEEVEADVVSIDNREEVEQVLASIEEHEEIELDLAFIGEQEEMESEAAIIENHDEVEKNPSQTKESMKKEMFQTIIAQLELNKKMDPLEYERQLKGLIGFSLPIKEYFTFVRLLLEHYIQFNQKSEIEELVVTAKEKVIGYPILEKELEFIMEHYCGKKL